MSSYTRYFRLVKPSIDEPYDIGVFNSNLDKIDKELGERVASDPFVSEDEDDPEELATMPEVMADGDDRSTLFNKLSVVVKNVRYLIKLIGDTDISAIGDGSITGAIDGVNEDLNELKEGHMLDIDNAIEITTSTLTTSKAGVVSGCLGVSSGYVSLLIDGKTFARADSQPTNVWVDGIKSGRTLSLSTANSSADKLWFVPYLVN